MKNTVIAVLSCFSILAFSKLGLSTGNHSEIEQVKKAVAEVEPVKTNPPPNPFMGGCFIELPNIFTDFNSFASERKLISVTEMPLHSYGIINQKFEVAESLNIGVFRVVGGWLYYTGGSDEPIFIKKDEATDKDLVMLCGDNEQLN